MTCGALLFLGGEYGTWGVVAFAVWTLGYTLWLVSTTRQHGPSPRWQWGSRSPAKD